VDFSTPESRLNLENPAPRTPKPVTLKTMTDPFSSARLTYRAVDIEADKALFTAINNVSEEFSLYYMHELRSPSTISYLTAFQQSIFISQVMTQLLVSML
jgi:hypothetical protein